MGHVQNEKQFFLAEITKAGYQLAGRAFLFVPVINLFLFFVMYFVKKGSKTAFSAFWTTMDKLRIKKLITRYKERCSDNYFKLE